MTTHEAEITDRLARAASLIQTTSRLPSITWGEVLPLDHRPEENPGRSDVAHFISDDLDDALELVTFQSTAATSNDPRAISVGSKSWQRIVTVAAVAGLVLIGAGVVSRFNSDPGDVQVASDQTLVRIDLGLPSPAVSELLPLIADPPAAFGEGQRAEREGQQRTGQWTSAAIAIPTADGYEQPIVISVLRGDAFYLDKATPLEADLRSPAFGDLISFTDGPWTAVATRTDPIVSVSGAVELSALLDVLSAMTRAESSPDSLVLDTTQLPDGYSLIVEPTALGQDQTPRNVVADDYRTASLNEISDRANPLLAAALGGGRLQAVNIGPTTGWAGIYDDEEFGPLRSLIWSPEPGVVLELSVVAERWSLDDTIALAEDVTMVTPDQWNLRYFD
ncbi:MAG: hypothetical protein AAGE88_10380 [Actinomycetota bacterium]